MSETAVLNETVAWDVVLDDSIGPDYGWERLRRSQLATLKPAGGRPWTRTVGNGGHSTQFSWTNRSLACIEKLKQFAEQYEDGFFTVIDHDGGGRHYVGRFVGDMPVVQAGNDRYNAQGWTFEELPGCPMLEYPALWDRWAVQQRPIDDFGDQLVATGSTVAGAWARPAPAPDENGIYRVPRQLLNAAPTAGDWLTHEYRGYGFRLWAGMGPAYGNITLSVDGGDAIAVDLYQPDVTAVQIAYEKADLPLDIHRVKISLPATRNELSTSSAFLLDKFEVMR